MFDPDHLKASVTYTVTLYRDGSVGYVLDHDLVEKIARYDETVTVKHGTESDGASGAIDIPSRAWHVHDRICKDPHFDSGNPITAWQAAVILHDILLSEGRRYRAVYWGVGTFLFGCRLARVNGWF